MYTEQDYADICAQKSKRLIAVLIPVVLLLALLVYSLVIRSRLISVIATIAMGILWIAGYGLFVKPVNDYRRHMDLVMHGRVRTVTGAFKEMEEQITMREGVQYYALLLNVGRMDDEADDRLFYYDANLPRPEWEKGEMLTVTHHDKALGKWERA